LDGVEKLTTNYNEDNKTNNEDTINNNNIPNASPNKVEINNDDGDGEGETTFS